MMQSTLFSRTAQSASVPLLCCVINVYFINIAIDELPYLKRFATIHLFSEQLTGISSYKLIDIPNSWI
jgi:hypothetical protein